MAFTNMQIEELRAPLSTSVVRERKGGGNKLLKYIKGDYAIDTANKIFGFGQWGYKVVARSHEVIEDEKKGRIEFYTADIELSVDGSVFSFPGDGVGIVTTPFTVEMHEKARKEATTDALKRALRHYGDQFGLSLYDEDDYLENPDGSLVPVKYARAGQSARQIVEAQKPAPGQSIAHDVITDQQRTAIERLCTALHRTPPDHLDHLSSLKAAQEIRDLTAAYNQAKQQASKNAPQAKSEQPNQKAAQMFLSSAEVGQLRSQWAEALKIADEKVLERWELFKKYLEKSNHALADADLTPAFKERVLDYLQAQKKAS